VTKDEVTKHSQIKLERERHKRLIQKRWDRRKKGQGSKIKGEEKEIRG
jgi:hypothetical protein